MKRNWLATALLFALPLGTMAQEDPLYLMEAGGALGLVTYLGDFNAGIFSGAQPMGGLVMRRVLNPYMHLRLAAFTGQIKGSSKDVATYYPAFDTSPYSFNHRLTNVAGGLGLTHVSGGEKNVVAANIFLGLGVKYKVAQRLNLALQWGVHFATTDKIDGVADPYAVKSVGLFKNKDGYSTLELSLTYSFMAKCRTCNKDD